MLQVTTYDQGDLSKVPPQMHIVAGPNKTVIHLRNETDLPQGLQRRQVSSRGIILESGVHLVQYFVGVEQSAPREESQRCNVWAQLEYREGSADWSPLSVSLASGVSEGCKGDMMKLHGAAAFFVKYGALLRLVAWRTTQVHPLFLWHRGTSLSVV